MLIASAKAKHRSAFCPGWHFSAKHGTYMAFQNPLVRDYLLCLDFRNDVMDFAEARERFDYRDSAGRRRTFWADVMVQFSGIGEPTYVQLVRSTTFADARFQANLEAKHRAIRRAGGRFEVVLDVDVRAEPHTSNLRRLAAYAFLPRLPDDVWADVRQAGRGKPVALADLRRMAQPFGVGLSDIYRELFCGRLFADLGLPLTMSTVVFWKESSNA